MLIAGMKIAVAPNAFKGSLTALEAAKCIRRGLAKTMRRTSFVLIPMADGGDGSLSAVVDATGGRVVRRRVSNPLGRRISAPIGISGDGRTAIIEMASASGLVLLSPRERNPMVTSSRGTGELMVHAMNLGVSRIIVCIGGSATNDGGTGMARALGVRFLDERGEELPEGGGKLVELARIDVSGLDGRIRKTKVDVACDVDNPLHGVTGAACVYAPQKGATKEMVRILDAGLRRLDKVIAGDLGLRVGRLPGAGAAGGMGAGLVAFAGGRLTPGVELVASAVGLRKRLAGCGLVVTGEGRLDGQSVRGKTPVGVARIAKELGLRVIAIAGCLGEGVESVLDHGIDAYFAASQRRMSEREIRARGASLLTACASRAGRMLIP